jgi:multicomponent Na+:H+ antiporter subunit D
MLCLSMTVGSVVVAYTFWTATEQQQRYFFYPLFMVVIAGTNWAFLTGDLFNLFVAYEVMLLGSYGSMMVGAGKSQLRQTLKYIAINGIGSTFFVVACGLIYATTGTLNMADLALRTAQLQGSQAAMVTAGSMVLLVVFLMKAACFPLFFWLPDAYPIVPSGVNGFFAGLLTKVGVYSLLRVFVMVFRQDGSELAVNIVLIMSGFTMLLGVMGAMCQWDIRRILSWHIISQVGYMLMGIGLTGSSDERVVTFAIAGTVFYIVHHIIVKSCLFLVGGIAERIAGTQELKKMGGVLELSPGVAGLFLIASFSLAGMPPFSGFLSKFVLVRAGLTGGNYFIVFIAIATSFLTLYSMTKIWSYAFWRDRCRDKPAANYRGMMIPTAVLVIFTVVMGVWAQPFYALAERTAKDLMHPENYAGRT